MAEKKKSLLEIAVGKMKRRQALAKKVDDAEKKEKSFEDAKKKAAEEKKDARKKLDEADSKEEIIKALAEIKPESRSRRSHQATYGFFDLLNKFNKNGKTDFSDSYNALQNTELIKKALLDAAEYNAQDDTIIIRGEKIRAAIAEEQKQLDALYKEAEEKLDLALQGKSEEDVPAEPVPEENLEPDKKE